MRASCVAFSFCVLSFSSVAGAQSADSTEGSAESSEVELEQEQKAQLRWSARVFVGDTLTQVKVAGESFWRNEQAVNSARVGMRFDHSTGLRTVIKLELGDGDAELKDGYIRLALPADFSLQAGRFKKPISAIALSSKWELPSIERGLLDSLAVEGQSLPFAGGRGDGLMVDYRAPFLPGKSGVMAALLQNELGVGDFPLDAKEDFAQDVYARLYVEPVKGLHLASSFALIGYLAKGGSSFRHAPLGTIELKYKGPWLRAWAEGMAGKSMFARANGTTDGGFWAARFLAAPRLRPGVPRRLEPFVGASMIDPHTNDSDNSNYELQGGVNFAFAKEWNLKFEISRVFAEGIFSSATESTAFRIQLGARLKE